MIGKLYDPRVRLSKADKVQKESEAKLKKLKELDTKEGQAKEKTTSTPEAMDTSNMPELISYDDEEE